MHDILIHRKCIFFEEPVKALVLYSMWQSLYDEMEKSIPNIEFHEGLMSQEQLKAWAGGDTVNVNQPKVLFIDDLMACSNSQDLLSLFTVGAHHLCITTFILVQSLFPPGRYSTSINRNAHYLVIFNSKRDLQQVQTLGRQIMPGASAYFMDAYKRATADRYGYLLVDLHPCTPDVYKLRSSILPGQLSVIYGQK